MAERWCDFERLAETLIAQSYSDARSIHGASHWKRVEQNGLWLSVRSGADSMITRLFAWFHDSRRYNDGTDPEHGLRGAEYAASLRGEFFELEDDSFEKLVYACTWHTDQDFSADATIGTCWDSDRLDLGRVGMLPSERFMSTAFGKEVARTGSFQPFLDENRRVRPINFES